MPKPEKTEGPPMAARSRRWGETSNHAAVPRGAEDRRPAEGAEQPPFLVTDGRRLAPAERATVQPTSQITRVALEPKGTGTSSAPENEAAAAWFAGRRRCQRCGQPAEGGLCSVCEEAFRELRGLSLAAAAGGVSAP